MSMSTSQLINNIAISYQSNRIGSRDAHTYGVPDDMLWQSDMETSGSEKDYIWYHETDEVAKNMPVILKVSYQSLVDNLEWYRSESNMPITIYEYCQDVLFAIRNNYWVPRNKLILTHDEKLNLPIYEWIMYLGDIEPLFEWCKEEAAFRTTMKELRQQDHLFDGHGQLARTNAFQPLDYCEFMDRNMH